MEEVYITIIGAGVVGLAIAAELSKKYKNIIVLEKNSSFGQEISSRNSEVIHSGIYYPNNYLKAKLCVEGRKLLYEYCKKYSIPHLKIGKLIVATNTDEEKQLKELYNNGFKNGVEDIKIIDKKEILKLEPNVKGTMAIFSPQTGIIDSHSLMKSLYFNAKSNEVLFSFESEVNYIEKTKGGYIIGIKNSDYKFCSKIVINSAGLNSDNIAKIAGINIETCGYKLVYCKGSYFAYNKKSPVRKLIYPLPHNDLKGLGIHATLNLAWRLRFGPDTEYIDKIDYNVDYKKIDHFYNNAIKLINGLEKENFTPDTSGIRPKIKGTGIKDYIINDEIEKGLYGFINLIGIESPGLTSCLAIANYVKKIIEKYD